MGIITVIWEKFVEFKFEWKKITAAAIVSPVLYLIAFGWGLSEKMVGGKSYILFLIPGIIALSTMNNSFSATSTSLNIQRVFERSFKQIAISPTPWWQYIMGQVIGGSIRGMYAGMVLIVIIVLSIGFNGISPIFFLVMFLNGLVFSGFGTLAAIIAKTHSDVARLSTFVITPMTFLCNTFFPLDKIPKGVQIFIDLLPLTHASSTLRSLSYGEGMNLKSILVLLFYAIVFYFMSLYAAKRVHSH